MLATLGRLIMALWGIVATVPTLEAAGIVLLVVGTAVIWGPYALLVAGVLCMLKASSMAGEGQK